MSRFSSLLLLCIISVSAVAEAQSPSRWGSGIDFSARASNREKSRWSLTEWLAMKDRNRMMDMWLSLNTPSPFEFSLGGSYNSSQAQGFNGNNSQTSSTSFRGEAVAYAQLVGLAAEYENNTEERYNDLTGAFNLRLLGNSIQNTSLTLHFGQRTRTPADGERLVQQFGQASLQIYLTKYFGIDGKYRYFLPTSNETWDNVEGSVREAGAFIDFKALRVFGAWYEENQKSKTPSVVDPTEAQRTGIRSGIKIFF